MMQHSSSNNGTEHAPAKVNIPIAPTEPYAELKRLVEDFTPSLITLVTVAMLALGMVHLLPQDLKTRLRASWDLFWPPWQAREMEEPLSTASFEKSQSERAQESKTSTGTGQTEDDKLRLKTTKLEELERAKARAQSSPQSDTRGGEQVKKHATENAPIGLTPENSERLESKQLAGMEQAKSQHASLTSEEKVRLRAQMKTKEAAKATDRNADTKSSPSVTLTDEEKARLRKKQMAQASTKGLTEEEQAKMKAKTSAASHAATLVKPEDSPPKGLPSQSERGRRAKVVANSGASPSDAKGKGKGRMEGERPSDSSTPPTPTEKDSRSKSGSAASSAASSASGTDTEDDKLMAGDYRPLKSALKKSKKKPRQTKNTHHNYFMTMRGHRPHLVPFPHGLHPKPHALPHSLWWNNIPKNADHIMIPPPVPKEPEKDEEVEEVKTITKTAESTSSSSAGVGTDGATKSEAKELTVTKESEVKTKDPDDKAKRRSSASGPAPATSSTAKEGDKAKEKERAKENLKELEKEKEKEKAKVKAATEAKAKAKSEAEKQVASSSPEIESVEPPAAPKVDPRLYALHGYLLCKLTNRQKATFVTQGLLCSLLYMRE